MKHISRKDFLKSAAIGAAGLTAASVGFAGEAEAICTYADTIAWDGAYDVVVMGAGGAGMTAAIYASRAGSSVLLFDVAPEWEAGGNTRYCAQCIRYGNDKEKMMTYYKATYGEHPYDEEILDVLTDAELVIEQTLIDDFGADSDAIYYRGFKAEYPEYPGSDAMATLTVEPGWLNASLFKLLRKNLYAETNIDMWYNARGTKLLQDPETKTVIGIEIEKDGETRKIRAYNGVVMACGGFENNREMLCNYLNITACRPIGSLWNRGDGIKMALEINADLWHMNVYENYPYFPYAIDVDESYGGHAVSALGGPALWPYGFLNGAFVVTGADGSRFQNEIAPCRHGHVYWCGEWKIPECSSRGFIIMDAVHRASLGGNVDMTEEQRVAYKKQWGVDPTENKYAMSQGVEECFISADSIEELAEKIGADPAILAKTVQNFNFFAEAGEDYAFGRSANTMRALTEAPFYALPTIHSILNTQGGAKRNARAEVLDTQGQPIPHLYSAGEFGGLTGRDYEGATNISECLIFGRIAGLNAAAAKEALPAIQAEAVNSELLYTLGSGSSEMKQERIYELKANEAVGTGLSIGGEIDVKVEMDAGKLVNVEVLYAHETPGIADHAVKLLPGMILEAQGIEVDNIAGATMATAAIKSAVLEAMAKLQ